jgi:hypothetical protein
MLYHFYTERGEITIYDVFAEAFVIHTILLLSQHLLHFLRYNETLSHPIFFVNIPTVVLNNIN